MNPRVGKQQCLGIGVFGEQIMADNAFPLAPKDVARVAVRASFPTTVLWVSEQLLPSGHSKRGQERRRDLPKPPSQEGWALAKELDGE